MFLIGARILSGSITAEQAGEVFARLADVLLRTVHTRAEIDFAETYGRIRGGESAVVALGRLGAREMTASSDLDLIVIYDFDHDHPESDGEHSLYGGQYYARFTQRLISALTARTNYGVLYQVDMRLRPSGRSGPVATQIDGFISYQEREAWTWEHMALTRARVVSGPADLVARIETAIRDVLCRKCDTKMIADDVVVNAGGDRQGKGRCRYLGSQICRGRACRYRVHRAISAADPCRDDAGHPRYIDGAHAGKGGAAWRAQARRRRSVAASGAAVPRSDADPAAVPVQAPSIRRRRAPAC